ncbi:uncharacterized protein SOCE26_082540 [Sorangium cellulosum]|uniref:Uncharacterized protein n=1 Tax=Sorangium cellulosum TaxID=56 RepID=A0A2L0F598_SORCE|nr:hypothetical protein [Sorangium cellulosum]AUX46745.1 uncharacterized protein SOCE26_082540 [Sorangium cellulosum]
MSRFAGIAGGIPPAALSHRLRARGWGKERRASSAKKSTKARTRAESCEIEQGSYREDFADAANLGGSSGVTPDLTPGSAVDLT